MWIGPGEPNHNRHDKHYDVYYVNSWICRDAVLSHARRYTYADGLRLRTSLCSC